MTDQPERNDIDRWLDEIEALAEAATPGPWDIRSDQRLDPLYCVVNGADGKTVCRTGQNNLHDSEKRRRKEANDCCFIAASRTALPLLARMVRRMNQALDVIGDTYDGWGEWNATTARRCRGDIAAMLAEARKETS